jgi:hypothetical protein
MSDFEFDVPLPKKKAGAPQKDKYGLLNFPIGGSKFIAGIKSAALGSELDRKNEGCKFVTRQVVENGIKGLRVWRLS